MEKVKEIIISIIVTTKNEEKHIENCLKSIKEQDYPVEKIEIIVVDNSSDDKTKEIAKKYTDLVFDKGPERSAQRNFGVSQASADIILYLDADMMLTKTVVSEILALFEKNSQLTGLYIPENIVGESFFSRVRHFERSFYNATVIDCVRAVRKETFNKVQGFDEAMTGPEDWDFDRKIRDTGPVDIISSPLNHNEGEVKLIPYLKKKTYYSGSMDTYIKKWGKNDPDVKKQLGAYYRLVGVFVEKGKWKNLLMNPHFTMGMYFLRVCVGASFVLRKVR